MAPDSKRIFETTPGASLLIATPLTGAIVPTAVICPCQCCVSANAEATDSGGGPDFCISLPMAMSEEIWENLIITSAPTSSTRPPMTSRILPALRGLGTETDWEVTALLARVHVVK